MGHASSLQWGRNGDGYTHKLNFASFFFPGVPSPRVLFADERCCTLSTFELSAFRSYFCLPFGLMSPVVVFTYVNVLSSLSLRAWAGSWWDGLLPGVVFIHIMGSHHGQVRLHVSTSALTGNTILSRLKRNLLLSKSHVCILDYFNFSWAGTPLLN